MSGSRSRCMVALLVLVVALASACSRPARRAVLVSIDTLRADHLGCYGDKKATTPNLDRLAASGVRFAQAISPTPLTLPSHTTLLSGVDPPVHGVHDNGIFRVPSDLPLLQETLHEAGFRTGAFVGASVLDRRYGLARGFDRYDDRMSPRLAAVDAGYAERTADRVVDAALAWLPRAGDHFFLWVHLYDPHADYRPPPEYANRASPYDGEIAFADAQLGRLLAAIAERFPDGRTLVVVTSDHGESLGEHGELTHGLTAYDATQHVPLLVSGPGVPKGTVPVAQVRLKDVAPTILARLGVPAPAGMSGVDLGPLFDGTGAGRTAYVETMAPWFGFGWSPVYGVRSAGEKYLRGAKPELYALDDDPSELSNMAEESPAQMRALDAELDLVLQGGRSIEPVGEPDADQRERLESLGYVLSSGPTPIALGQVGEISASEGLPALTQLARALGQAHAGHFESARRLAREVVGPGPELALARAGLDNLAGAYEDAERWARKALDAGGDPVEAQTALGTALEGQGHLDLAEQAFRSAADADDGAAAPMVGLGRIAEARGDLASARTRYEEARSRRSNSAEAIWRLAALDIEGRDAAGAQKMLRLLPREEIDRPEAAIRLARAEARAGLRKQALARVTRALAAMPGHEGLLALKKELGAG